MLQQMDGARAGRCYDSGSASFQPGGETQVYPCVREWFQFVSFGNGHNHAPVGSLFSTIPKHIVNQINVLGHDQIPYMCLGVYDRDDLDELDWDDEEYENLKLERRRMTATTLSVSQQNNNESKYVPQQIGVWESLSEWQDAAIITTQCTNTGAVIEWVFVPFIEEEHEDDMDTTVSDEL